MLKAFVPAAIMTILAATSLWAAPAVSQLQTATTFYTMQVRDGEDRDDRRGMQRHNRGDHHYTPGRRYKSAPSHYRRYAQRPHDWRSRGCILVGPLWFCA